MESYVTIGGQCDKEVSECDKRKSECDGVPIGVRMWRCDKKKSECDNGMTRFSPLNPQEMFSYCDNARSNIEAENRAKGSGSDGKQLQIVSDILEVPELENCNPRTFDRVVTPSNHKFTLTFWKVLF